MWVRSFTEESFVSDFRNRGAVTSGTRMAQPLVPSGPSRPAGRLGHPTTLSPNSDPATQLSPELSRVQLRQRAPFPVLKLPAVGVLTVANPVSPRRRVIRHEISKVCA